jgi:ParB-like chromosome segregation protein Spo0J
MELRTLPIDGLKPALYNPRVTLEPGSPGYRRLERSLAEFTLVQPIVWNEQTGHIVSGHQRLKILQDKGPTEIEVAVVDLPSDREKALNITLNNSQVGSNWELMQRSLIKPAQTLSSCITLLNTVVTNFF